MVSSHKTSGLKISDWVEHAGDLPRYCSDDRQQ